MLFFLIYNILKIILLPVQFIFWPKRSSNMYAMISLYILRVTENDLQIINQKKFVKKLAFFTMDFFKG